MMLDLLIPYALDRRGRMVDAKAVPRGLACDCVCPQCKAPMIARQGDEKVWHFAHQSLSDCRGAVETALHRFGKQIICDRRLIRLPGASVEIAGYAERIMWPSNWTYADAQQEVTMSDLRPDVLLSNPFRTVAVEIFVAHRVPPAKVDRLRKLGLDTIEIDLSDIRWNMRADRLEEQVLRRARRVWLANRIVETARAERLRLHALGEQWWTDKPVIVDRE